MRSSLRRRGVVFALVVASASCSNPLVTSAYGTIRARVRDQGDVPVPGAKVAVSLSSNSFVSGLTTAGGTIEFGASVGSHSVTVTSPVGYAAGLDPLTKLVSVEGGRTVDVDFVLTRSAVTGQSR